jgi:beta-N-acetylhexosaminidase
LISKAKTGKNCAESLHAHSHNFSHKHYSEITIIDLRHAIGQLFITGFRGTTAAEESRIARDISLSNLGGVILFDRFLSGPSAEGNVISKEQLQYLCRELQSVSKTPLFIAVDQEGGAVQRLREKHGFAPIPSAEEMGRDNSFAESAVQAHTTGKVLAETGINCNFAPVADLSIEPNNPIIGKIGRSFGSDAAAVSRHCEVWLDGLRQFGILGCLKHFPGHGSSIKDSHKGFVDISATWQQHELLPYHRLVQKKKVEAIMMGHLYHSGLDPLHPASLSRSIIQGMLRTTMHYNGLIITDDMQMHAITQRYGILEAVVLAIEAGVDLVILGNNLDYDETLLQKAIDAVEEAVQDGRLSAETIFAAFKRISAAKKAWSEAG